MAFSINSHAQAQKISTIINRFAHASGDQIKSITKLSLIEPQMDQRTHSDSAPDQNPVLLALA